MISEDSYALTDHRCSGSPLTHAARLLGPSAAVRIALDEPRGRFRILPSRTAIRGNRSALLGLADMLRGDRPLYARGVAMLNVILTDATGPANTDRRGDALTRQLQIARARLTR